MVRLRESKLARAQVNWFVEGELKYRLYGLVAGDPTSDYKEIMEHAQ
jgi:hypothetical protein